METPQRFAIIDSNRNFHNLFRGVLRSLGWRRIDSFFSAADALSHLKQTYIDMAFTDVNLIGGSGLDLIRFARHGRLANPMMPMVLLTTYTNKSTIERAVGAGADLVLAKPISPKLISERIGVLLSRAPDYIRTSDGYFGPEPDIERRRRASRRLSPFARLEVEELQPRSHHRPVVVPAEEQVIEDAIYLD